MSTIVDKFNKVKDVLLDNDPDMPSMAEKAPELPTHTKSIYIPSRGIEHHTESLSMYGSSAKFVTINVNGNELKIECDKQVEVPEEFYDAAMVLVEKQRS